MNAIPKVGIIPVNLRKGYEHARWMVLLWVRKVILLPSVFSFLGILGVLLFFSVSNVFVFKKGGLMFFKEELWLILVGLIVGTVVRKINGSPVAWKKIALYACVLSVLVGELGMLTQLFFPSDLLGLMLTCLAALIGAKIAIGERTAANRSHVARGGGAARKK